MAPGAGTPNLYHARLLLADPFASPLEDGALLVLGDRIVAVGRTADLRSAHPGAARIDFGDAVLLPPLVNAHTHLELTHFPHWASQSCEAEPRGDFVDWILQMIRVKRLTGTDPLAASLSEGIRRSLAAGTGAVGDILSSLAARTAYQGAPLRGRCFLETLGRDPENSRRRLRSVESICREGRLGRLQPGIAPHALYTLDDAHLSAAFALARRLGVGGSIHFAESEAEADLLLRGEGPLAERLFPEVGWETPEPKAFSGSLGALLESRGGLRPEVLLVHGVQVGEDDIDRIARAGATVVLCPRSNARLGVGVAPVARYRAAGVSLALGTDSLASCDSLSVWDEIAYARRCFAGILGPRDLLAMATGHGSSALGLEGEMGTLVPGAGAHFQVLRPQQLPTPDELVEFLVSPGRTVEVDALYLGGNEVLHYR